MISLLNKFDNENIVKLLKIKDMDIKWIEPKTTVGDVAKGKYYYHREDIVDDIWSELEKGNSILIAAPRRAGKTSIMRYIEDNPKNCKVIFENIQGIDSGKRFYATLYRLLLSCLSKNQKIKRWFKKTISSKSISELDIKGKVKIENLPLDFIDEIDKLVIEINEKEGIENIVLLIDELPDVLFNISKKDNNEAKLILKNLRRWRQSKINKKVKFVFAGSMGIHYVVNVIENRNSDLNDLATINCNP
ncbi:MAG: AAA-like domain-containing protein, partial [Prevotellaceae bacterium]|nr:AAA-like domain-containing protein [Prevotellaceae bacterium]